MLCYVNAQWFERNLLKASHPFFTLRTMFYLPLSLFNFISLLNFFYSLLQKFIIFPPQCFYSLLYNFYYFPSSMFFIPLLHLLIYSIYFSIHKYIDLLATLHRPLIHPTSIPHRPHIDPTSTLHWPHFDPTSAPYRPHIDPTRPHIDPTLNSFPF